MILGVSGYYRTKLPNGALILATTFTYSVTGNGSQAFTVYDRAGNSKVVTANVTNIDKTLPGGTIVPSTTAWTKGPITLTFSGTDAGGLNVGLRARPMHPTKQSELVTAMSSPPMGRIISRYSTKQETARSFLTQCLILT